jgi:hypothetical protein
MPACLHPSFISPPYLNSRPHRYLTVLTPKEVRLHPTSLLSSRNYYIAIQRYANCPTGTFYLDEIMNAS